MEKIPERAEATVVLVGTHHIITSSHHHIIRFTHMSVEQQVMQVKQVKQVKQVCVCVVCAGSVGFLEQPSMAFVRLQEAVLLESVLEVPVPVRFLFLLLGPPTANMDYHQIGRSISTLMSDKVIQYPEAAALLEPSWFGESCTMNSAPVCSVRTSTRRRTRLTTARTYWQPSIVS